MLGIAAEGCAKYSKAKIKELTKVGAAFVARCTAHAFAMPAKSNSHCDCRLRKATGAPVWLSSRM